MNLKLCRKLGDEHSEKKDRRDAGQSKKKNHSLGIVQKLSCMITNTGDVIIKIYCSETENIMSGEKELVEKAVKGFGKKWDSG